MCEDHMGRGGKVGSRKIFKKKFRSKDKGSDSDDSDEDYVVSDDENGVSECSDEEFRCHLDENASGEDDFVVEEEQLKKVRKGVGSKTRKSFGSRKVRKKNGRKRPRFSYQEEEDYCVDNDEDYRVDDDKDNDEDYCVDDGKDIDEDYHVDDGKDIDEDFHVDNDKDCDEDYRVDNDNDEDYRVDNDNDNDYEEEEDVDDEVEDEDEDEDDEDEDVDVDEDGDGDEDEDEDEDEDFMLEEEDFSDEEEPLVRKRATNTKRARQGARKNNVGKFCRKRKPKAAKKPSRNKRRKKSGPRALINSDDDDFSDNNRVEKNTRRRKPVQRQRSYVAQSDLDTFLSGSSDFDYTISEEEREQVREAQKLCGHLRSRARTVPSPPRIEESNLRQPRKSRPPVRKGKEKVEEVEAEVIKQVCGICLSEEDKRRVRGTLNCCSHFFCFSCVMEWAKVESRCPLCKQRFQTISKPARSTAGIDLREVVVQVPERDQVYQPSEEELRSYLDPYENVICIECNEGGDDNLMLLCDLCDSPAHTYCVGLGREVPEGNWYCVNCMSNNTTIAQGSSSPQPPSRLSDRRTTNNLLNRTFPVATRDGLDLNSLSSPRTPNVHGFENIPSPRLPVEVQSTSPMSQAVAPTLLRRRFLRLHINHMRSSHHMGLVNNRTDGVSAANPCGGATLSSQLGQGTIERAHTITRETTIPSPTLFEENLLHGNPSPLMQDGFFLDSETSHLPRQVLQDPHLSMPIDRASSNGTILNTLRGLEVESSTTVDRNLNGAVWPELPGVNSQSNCERIHQYNNVLNTGSDNGSLPPVGDERDYCEAKELLQPMIESHLKNYLSRDVDLDQSTANNIATKAAGTILAACGFEYPINEACRSSPPSQCSHIELSMGEEQRSLIKGLCSTCFDSYVRDVVKKITDNGSWLNLSL